MGEVWMAQQSHPVRRRVALKLIKSGVDSDQIIARFEAERQALAMMDHQNIARVLDAGQTDDGLPYFVMELVGGIPITEYCDANELSIDERLALFVQVCNAVQHAHQKGIIHRDLKPSNVLVCQYDGEPVPKVIDFGLAKATEMQTHLTDKTMFTEFGQVVGTLQYMSPEQAEMNERGVDTRTDIYSLGVMLYELLTGSTPIERDTLRQAAIMNVLQSIRETEPPLPSSRLSSSAEAIAGISRQRKIDPRALQRILKGDLDWIVMKSLDKDRERRYATASDFAQDVQRYAGNEPVEAHPPSLAYRVRRGYRRHRTGYLSVAAIAMLLIGGIASTTLLYFRASTAEGIARKNETKAVAAAKNEQIEKQNALTAKNLAVNAERAALRAKELAIEARENEATEKKRAFGLQRSAEAEKEKAQDAKNAAKKAQELTEEALASSNYLLANAKWDSGRPGEAIDSLMSVPRKYRNLEWHLSQRQFLGSDVTLYGHLDSITQCVFSVDGRRIFSIGEDHSFRIWDAATGAERETLLSQGAPATSLAISGDGKRLAIGSHGKVVLWDIGNEKIEKNIEVSLSWVQNIGFNQDGTILAVVGFEGDKTSAYGATPRMEVWNIENKVQLHQLSNKPLVWQSHQFDDSQDSIVGVNSAGTVERIDIETGKMVEIMQLDITGPGSLRSSSFSPDGRLIAVMQDSGDVSVWRVDSGKLQVNVSGGGSSSGCLAFSPDGAQLAAGHSDGSVMIWNVETGLLNRKLVGHTDSVKCVAFHPEGHRLASGGDDSTLKLWSTVRRSGSGRVDLPTSDSRYGGIAVDRAGNMMACTALDGSIKLWNLRNWQEEEPLVGQPTGVRCLSFDVSGELLVGGGMDGSLLIWNIATGNLIKTLKLSEDPVLSLACAPKRPIVACSVGRLIQIISLIDGQILKSLGKDRAQSLSLAFSPNGEHVVEGNLDGQINVWNVEKAIRIQSARGGETAVDCVAISHDGTMIASTHWDSTVRLWDAGTLTQIAKFDGRFKTATFSEDGSRLLVGGGSHMTVWDVSRKRELASFLHDGAGVHSVCLSEDGTRLVVGGGEVSSIQDLPRHAEVNSINSHNGEVIRTGFAMDRNDVYIQCLDGTIFEWGLDSEEPRLVQSEIMFEKTRRLSADQSLLVVQSGDRVQVVDINFKKQPREASTRRFKSQMVSFFHAQKAKLFQSVNDWFPATFHHAWNLIHTVNTGGDSSGARQELETSYRHLNESQRNRLASLVKMAIRSKFAEKNEVSGIDFRVTKVEPDGNKVVLCQVVKTSFRHQTLKTQARVFRPEVRYRDFEIAKSVNYRQFYGVRVPKSFSFEQPHAVYDSSIETRVVEVPAGVDAEIWIHEHSDSIFQD